MTETRLHAYLAHIRGADTIVDQTELASAVSVIRSMLELDELGPEESDAARVLIDAGEALYRTMTPH